MHNKAVDPIDDAIQYAVDKSDAYFPLPHDPEICDGHDFRFRTIGRMTTFYGRHRPLFDDQNGHNPPIIPMGIWVQSPMDKHHRASSR